MTTFHLLILLGILLIAGIVGIVVRSASNTRARAQAMAAAPAAPIGHTTDGQPIYPVVGYTPDGRPVTADRAVGVHPQSGGTNAMAIAALVSALVFAPLGIVFGHVARSQMRRTDEQGDGLALAGLIIGYIGAASLLIWGIVVALVIAGN